MKGRELDLKVAAIAGWYVNDDEYWVSPEGKIGERRGEECPEHIPLYSFDLDSSFQIDKPGWHWTYDESRSGLEVSLNQYETPNFAVDAFVYWSECVDKQEAYALCRCLVAAQTLE